MSGDMEPREHLYKVLVVGDVGTGKTSIIKRYVHNIFSAHYKSTIGVDFALKVLNWDDGRSIIRLQLWDIAGQERFGNMTRVYYKEAVGAFVVFDVTRPSTFDAVAKWKADIDKKVFLPVGDGTTKIPVVLLANKSDLQRDASLKTNDEIGTFASQHGFIDWFETSAKDNRNIDDAASCLVKRILENDPERSQGDGSAHKREGTVTLQDKQQEGNGGGKGCSC
uniref:Ras-related protein Rab n=1 Tax=Palpitomonas bilix TaxID=652834 RepID=A0A7S3GMR1_9EUKA|mmetsp:Transcript_9940/g.26358  ORF Transcript_9940/g.26358 Transcript_9940/m.26358 type:complete len:223 (+) Transcript_9940:91-759(+)|eukprot:CAMPEP_0113888874 /NCGR_PEP_ID=MMETSP0780_2-20120614/13138_1 /TAXON_ID=652834 /ORGANISM="Palpitomonas bilix" /LENGTH=222 /DNA_ID=CAMNT_0000877819 /DNA_START=94 /DNA_END=762 /DNA_ORIENTATION=- /assembly_acc=CAM_ASM_000599